VAPSGCDSQCVGLAVGLPIAILIVVAIVVVVFVVLYRRRRSQSSTDEVTTNKEEPAPHRTVIHVTADGASEGYAEIPANKSPPPMTDDEIYLHPMGVKDLWQSIVVGMRLSFNLVDVYTKLVKKVYYSFTRSTDASLAASMYRLQNRLLCFCLKPDFRFLEVNNRFSVRFWDSHNCIWIGIHYARQQSCNNYSLLMACLCAQFWIKSQKSHWLLLIALVDS